MGPPTPATPSNAPSNLRHSVLAEWVAEVATLTNPPVSIGRTGHAEYERLCEEMVASGMFDQVELGAPPNSYLACSDASDVARVEDRTFICSRSARRRGPDEQLGDPGQMRTTLRGLSPARCAAARCTSSHSRWGPIGSPIAQIGVEITDSPYVVVNMRIMTRMGSAVLEALGADGRVRALRALGRRAAGAGRAGQPLAVQPRAASTSFTSPKTREIWSYGSGYGGNALLGKKCLALRIASTMARDEGWLAEHMLILGVEARRREDLRRRRVPVAPAVRPISRC